MIKKIQIRLVLMTVLLMYTVMPLYAKDKDNSYNEELRVGLITHYSNKEQIRIYNKELVMGYKQDEEFIVEMIFSGYDHYNVEAQKGYFIRSETSYASYDEVKKLCDSMQKLDYKAYPGVVGLNQWYIYLGDYENIELAGSALKELQSSFKGTSFNMIDEEGAYYQLSGEGEILLIVDGRYEYPQYEIMGKKAIMDLGDRQYRGRMEFGVYGNDSVSAINIIDLEEYLYGVLPSEMYYKWELEALKSQAVAARTFALYTAFQAPKHPNDPYDLDDTVYDQVYKGYGIEEESTNLAVDETKGEVITYKEKLISAFFHSTSGGRTENSENVWSSSVPYLKGVPDIYETEPEAKPWIVLLTANEIKKILEDMDIDIGDILDVKVTAYFDSGRVKSLSIVGSQGGYELEKNSIRKLGLRSTKFTLVKDNGYVPTLHMISGKEKVDEKNVIEGKSYIISCENDPEKLEFTEGQIVAIGTDNLHNYTNMQPSKDTYVFAGMGYGHGVGMSQSGAQNMASLGFDYKEILCHYYSGIDITKVSN